MTITTTQTLGSIVADIPASAPILYRHKLDFCCKGNRSLMEACLDQGIDMAQIVTEIEQARQRDVAVGAQQTWTERPLRDLINHILTTFHEPLRSELPELVAMAERVEKVHALHDGCPHGLAEHLQYVHQELLSHMEKEEQVLFPAILQGQGAVCTAPVRILMSEHDDHGASLEKIGVLTNGLTLPEAACTTFRVLYQRLASLEEDLMRHIHLENHVLFPRALQGELPDGGKGAACSVGSKCC